MRADSHELDLYNENRRRRESIGGDDQGSPRATSERQSREEAREELEIGCNESNSSEFEWYDEDARRRGSFGEDDLGCPRATSKRQSREEAGEELQIGCDESNSVCSRGNPENSDATRYYYVNSGPHSKMFSK